MEETIKIGLTTWSEHPSLLGKSPLTLYEYASVLPLVEVDTSFYGIPRSSTVEKWLKETPSSFQFIVKAHQGMTKHAPYENFFESELQMFQQYYQFVEPIIQANKLAAILFQFPPFFHCTKENVAYLLTIRKYFPTFPIALEFRHTSWYQASWREDMKIFLKQYNFILVAVDEPDIPTNSIPFLPEVTNSACGFIRLHGRNQLGWLEKGPQWRKKRTLYRYSLVELTEIVKAVEKMQKLAAQVVVIFNNNSGGDAADNALALKQLLRIEYPNLNPHQTDLF